MGVAQDLRASRHMLLPTERHFRSRSWSVTRFRVAHKPLPGRPHAIAVSVSTRLALLIEVHVRKHVKKQPVPRQRLDLGRSNVTQRIASSPMNLVLRSLPLTTSQLSAIENSKAFTGRLSLQLAVAQRLPCWPHGAFPLFQLQCRCCLCTTQSLRLWARPLQTLLLSVAVSRGRC